MDETTAPCHGSSLLINLVFFSFQLRVGPILGSSGRPSRFFSLFPGWYTVAHHQASCQSLSQPASHAAMGSTKSSAWILLFHGSPYHLCGCLPRRNRLPQRQTAPPSRGAAVIRHKWENFVLFRAFLVEEMPRICCGTFWVFFFLNDSRFTTVATHFPMDLHAAGSGSRTTHGPGLLGSVEKSEKNMEPLLLFGWFVCLFLSSCDGWTAWTARCGHLEFCGFPIRR